MWGPRAVGSLAPALTRPAFRRRSTAGAQILTDWAAIVGPALAAVTMPRRLSGTTLTLACAGPIAMELQHMSVELAAADQRPSRPGGRGAAAVRPGSAARTGSGVAAGSRRGVTRADRGTAGRQAQRCVGTARADDATRWPGMMLQPGTHCGRFATVAANGSHNRNANHRRGWSRMPCWRRQHQAAAVNGITMGGRVHRALAISGLCLVIAGCSSMATRPIRPSQWAFPGCACRTLAANTIVPSAIPPRATPVPHRFPRRSSHPSRARR